MSNIIEINSIDEIDKKCISLIVVYQSNCGTCDIAKKMVEIVSDSLKEVKYYKLNLVGKEDIVLKYKIKSIPFFLIFKEGEVLDTFTAFHSVIYLYDLLKKYLNN